MANLLGITYAEMVKEVKRREPGLFSTKTKAKKALAEVKRLYKKAIGC